MWAGVEVDLIPTAPGAVCRPSKDRRKDPKVWLAGELIVRCEHQGLTSLPRQLFIKTTLRTLVLTGNALTSLPSDIQQLKELRELKLGHNQLQQLPIEVCSLPNLEHLDVQYNQLQDIPSAICRLVHLSTVNLDGNPLSSELQAVWSSEAAARHHQQQHAQGKGAGRHAAATALIRLKEQTHVLVQHFMEQQEPEVVLQIKQAKLQLLQQASTDQILKLLCVADHESLANCLNIAVSTGLSSDLIERIKKAQAATTQIQQALNAAQAQQSSCSSSAPAADPAVHDQLAAALKNFEALCRPRRPGGNMYISAHATWRTLQRQMLERGWRCSTPKSPAAAADVGAVLAGLSIAEDEAARAGSAGSSPAVSPGGKRRYLTMSEKTRQRLEASGARKFEEWAAEKECSEQLERQRTMDLAQQEAKTKAQSVIERAAKAVENCGREKQWRSKVVEPFPHGTFSLTAEQLKAVRRAYQRPPDLNLATSD